MSPRQVVLTTWLTVATVLAAPVLLAVLAPDTLLALASAARQPHASCPLCGMTRAYLLLADGDVAGAAQLNAAAPAVFLASAGQAVLASLYALPRLRRPAP